MASCRGGEGARLHRSLKEAKRAALSTISAFRVRRYAHTPTRRYADTASFVVAAPPCCASVVNQNLCALLPNSATSKLDSRQSASKISHDRQTCAASEGRLARSPSLLSSRVRP